jgi:hypothetical protein
MLNPSIADETVLDPTLRRCMGFAKDWGYSGMDIVNVFPLVSTDPKGLKVGISSNAEALNLLHIGESAKHAEIVVAAFGANVEKYAPKDLLVETGRVVPPEKLRAIAFNRDLRTPSHPLYLRKDLEPQPYTWQW